MSLRRRRLAWPALITEAMGLYLTRLRKWILTWGATPEETRSPLPGDALVEHADGVATRAIGMLPLEPGSLVMERKMLHGIKQRAEHLAALNADDPD